MSDEQVIQLYELMQAAHEQPSEYGDVLEDAPKKKQIAMNQQKKKGYHWHWKRLQINEQPSFKNLQVNVFVYIVTSNTE